MWEKYKSLWKNAGKNAGQVFASSHKDQSALNVLGARVMMFCAFVSIFFIIGLLLFPLDANSANEIANKNQKPGWFSIILTAIFVAPFGLIASIIFAIDKIAK